MSEANFLEWIKQHLKVKKFFGHNQNAVLIQIITALIVYVLLLLVQEELGFQGTFLELTRIFKNNAFEEFDENVFKRR
jgi:IS4 transposase